MADLMCNFDISGGKGGGEFVHLLEFWRGLYGAFFCLLGVCLRELEVG